MDNKTHLNQINYFKNLILDRSYRQYLVTSQGIKVKNKFLI